MNEQDAARLLDTIEQARPAINEAQRIATEAAPVVNDAERETALGMAPLAVHLAETQREAARAMAPLASRMAEQARQWVEAFASRFRPLAEAVRAMGRRMAEQLREAVASVNERLRLAARTFGSALRSIAGRIIEGVHYLYEISTKRLAERMRSDSRRNLDGAAHFLERADCLLDQLAQTEEGGDGDNRSYQAADVMHYAVGSLEELACQVARTPEKTLPQALKKLVRSGAISQAEADGMKRAYGVRNQTRGVGHGAGPAYTLAARDVMRIVRQGSFAILNAAGIGTTPNPARSGFASRSSVALATGGA